MPAFWMEIWWPCTARPRFAIAKSWSRVWKTKSPSSATGKKAPSYGCCRKMTTSNPFASISKSSPWLSKGWSSACFVAVKTWMPREREAGCRSRRPEGAPAGRGPGWPESMRRQTSLADILADARVWKVKDASAAPSRPVWSTGKSALDARLPGGGWPTASLIEVLLDDTGLGEVQLFLPALVECQRCAGQDGTDSVRIAEAPWLVWIAPPHEPYAPALAQRGIDLRRLLVVRPAGATEALWAAEQALSSGVCAAVFLWLKGTDDRWLRRLKLAAESGGALGVLFRPERHRFESSPASLRLLMTQGEHETRLDLLKVQGGRSGPVDLGGP